MQPIIILPRTLEEKVSLAVDDDNIFLSPLLTSRYLLHLFPRTLIISTDIDPCLDNNSFFAFSGFSIDCKEGFNHVTKVLEQWIWCKAYSIHVQPSPPFYMFERTHVKDNKKLNKTEVESDWLDCPLKLPILSYRKLPYQKWVRISTELHWCNQTS